MNAAIHSEFSKAAGWGMSRAGYDAMVRWCDRNAKNPKVLRWLKRRPPPPAWEGTPTEWAYTESSIDIYP